jgi:hypothetical protein
MSFSPRKGWGGFENGCSRCKEKDFFGLFQTFRQKMPQNFAHCRKKAYLRADFTALFWQKRKARHRRKGRKKAAAS